MENERKWSSDRRGASWRRFASALVAVSSVCWLLALRSPAEASAPDLLLPEGIAVPGATERIALDGRLLLGGEELETIVLRTAYAPSEVIEHLLAHWKQRPVDWVRQDGEEESRLLIQDNHGGRRWLAHARRLPDGSTEVIRSIVLPAADRGARDLPYPPRGWEVVSSMEDRSGGLAVATWVLVAGEGAESRASILRSLASEGWVEGEGSTVGGSWSLRRGDEGLWVSHGPGPLGREWLHLRLEAP